jgi:hypothetical protein
MSKLNLINCVNNLFNGYDYNNNLIKKSLLQTHNTADNAWITIDKNVYSIGKNDEYMLKIFENYYGKDVKEYLSNEIDMDIKNKILLLEKLKKRKIGVLFDNDKK